MSEGEALSAAWLPGSRSPRDFGSLVLVYHQAALLPATLIHNLIAGLNQIPEQVL